MFRYNDPGDFCKGTLPCFDAQYRPSLPCAPVLTGILVRQLRKGPFQMVMVAGGKSDFLYNICNGMGTAVYRVDRHGLP